MSADASSPEPARGDRVRRVLVHVLVLNLLVAGAKLAMGWLSGSLSMVADGFHSLTDTASNVVGLVGISQAARPPDPEHPYGHRKFETLSALGIGGLLALTAWEILEGCLERLHSPSEVEATAASFLVMGTAMLVNLAVASYERRRGDALGSEILKADAEHTRSDAYVSLSVIVSLLAARLGYPQVDLVAALVITAVIARAAFRIVWRNAEFLVDSAAFPAERIREIALRVDGVEGVHKIRTRGRPPEAHADLHVQVDPELRIVEAHAIGHRVVDRLRGELGLRDVVVHVEPDASSPQGDDIPKGTVPP